MHAQNSSSAIVLLLLLALAAAALTVVQQQQQQRRLHSNSVPAAATSLKPSNQKQSTDFRDIDDISDGGDDDFDVDDNDENENDDDDVIAIRRQVFGSRRRQHHSSSSHYLLYQKNNKDLLVTTTSATYSSAATTSPTTLLQQQHFYAAHENNNNNNQTLILYPAAPGGGEPPKRLTFDVGDRDRRAKLGGASAQDRVDLNKCVVRGAREPYELSYSFEWPRRLRVSVPGDIYIGGLHMIHEREDNCICGPIMPQGGIQALEAMLFTLDYVNQRATNVLPGFRLGALILDDCDKDTYGLEQSVEFIKGSISMIGTHGSSSNADQQAAWASAMLPPAAANPACLPATAAKSGAVSVAGDGAAAAVGKAPVISGVVGAPSSGTSKEVASLLRLFQIPQVSFFSTSPVLSNPERYKYFSRTIPSDKDQTRVMINIIKMLGWSYISVIYEDSAYGTEAFDSLEQLARTYNVCIAHKDRLPKDTKLGYTKEAYYNNIVEGLASKKARGVVVFGSDQEVRDLMTAIKVNNLTTNFSFIGSDGWSGRPMVTVGLEDVVDGTLSVQPRAASIPGFEQYFRHLRPQNNTRNPWFKEYWEHMFRCRFVDSYVTPYNQAYERECSGTESYIDPLTGADLLQLDGQLQFVSDAVLVFAHTFRDLYIDLCITEQDANSRARQPQQQQAGAFNQLLCSAMNPPRGEDVLYVLRHVNFTSLTGMQFYFEDTESGDPPGRYNVIQFQRQRVVAPPATVSSNNEAAEILGAAASEVHQAIITNAAAGGAAADNTAQADNVVETVGVWVQVGAYGPGEPGGGFQLDMSKVRFRDHHRHPFQVPASYCSKACNPWERREIKEGDLCCWVCIPCPEWSIRPKETECYICPRGSVPFANYTYCIQVEETYMRIDSGEAIGALVFSTFGVVLTTFIIVTFVIHAETPVVKASGRELTYVLLAGIFLCYSMTFVLMQKPSDFVCGVQTFGIGFCFSVCYAALLTKTNRIARIFRAGKRTTKRPAFISPRSQLVICLCGVAIQLVINGVWLVMDPPVASHIYPRHDVRMLVCKSHTDASYMIAFAYPIVLLIICTVYAVLARKIPEAFNESKYIGFTMYTTCIIWLAFISIYFSTKQNIQLRLTTLSIAISISGTVSLACLFTPKLYIILLRPERNVRQSMMTTAQSKNTSSGGGVPRVGTSRPSNMSPQSSSIRQSSNSPQLQPLTAAAAAATAAAAITSNNTATALHGMNSAANHHANAAVALIVKRTQSSASTAAAQHPPAATTAAGAAPAASSGGIDFIELQQRLQSAKHTSSFTHTTQLPLPPPSDDSAAAAAAGNNNIGKRFVRVIQNEMNPAIDVSGAQPVALTAVDNGIGIGGVVAVLPQCRHHHNHDHCPLHQHHHHTRKAQQQHRGSERRSKRHRRHRHYDRNDDVDDGDADQLQQLTRPSSTHRSVVVDADGPTAAAAARSSSGGKSMKHSFDGNNTTTVIIYQPGKRSGTTTTTATTAAAPPINNRNNSSSSNCSVISGTDVNRVAGVKYYAPPLQLAIHSRPSGASSAASSQAAFSDDDDDQSAADSDEESDNRQPPGGATSVTSPSDVQL